MARSGTRLSRFFAVCVFVLGASCGGGGEGDSDGSGDSNSLIDHYEWRNVRAEEDVFGDRPDPVLCTFGWSPEVIDGVLLLDVAMPLCGYTTVTQPSRIALEAGESIRIEVRHDVLDSDDPDARAHFAVALDGEVVWELYVDIPQDIAVIEENVTLPRSFAEGVAVDFHVHNHGPNFYSLVAIERAE